MAAEALQIATSAESENPATSSFRWHTSPRHAAPWRQTANKLIAAEISSFARYFERLVQWQPREVDTGILFDAIQCPKKQVAADDLALPDCKSDRAQTVILLNGNLNHDYDIQATLSKLKQKLTRRDRVSVVLYNPYFRFLYWAANFLGLREGAQPETFITRTDLDNIAKLSGFEVVRLRPAVYFPWNLFGIGKILNHILPALPLFRWLSLVTIGILRPVMAESSAPSISIVIPARNERGNIENALKRMPHFGGAKTEIIYIEGHSKDGTWEEIQRVLPLYRERFTLSAYQQTGKGKSDAVRLGFSKAQHEIVTILDADLTMPPELLERFYDAYRLGMADFINGSRLTYPMEGEAMRFLNRLGNIFFAKALSLVLGTRLGDSLCGTKLLTRRDYVRMCQWRKDFGDFDPFGDFELLFPAAVLGMGIIDIPVRYRDRVYGSTNIRRFYHGWMLLKMTWIGLRRISLGRSQ
ncbi:MAG: glycosyltransferase family 2 protein [Deltaproteobacteria bacterium]|nr:glycosyltransferase family 2 protein [Deltaproteobacteria bacterium]